MASSPKPDNSNNPGTVKKAGKPRNPYSDPKRERKDMNAALFGGAIVLVVILLGLQNPLFNQKFSSNLALLLPVDQGGGQGIPVELMSSKALSLFIVAEAIKALTVAAIAILVILVVRSYTKGEFFSFRNARRVAAINWLAGIYPAGLFVQLMAENMVAYELSLHAWFDHSSTFTSSFLPIWMVLVMTISVASVMLYRAARMQEDQEGLI